MRTVIATCLCLALGGLSIYLYAADSKPPTPAAPSVVAEKAVAKVLTNPTFSGSLEEALAWVEKLSGAKMVVNWRVLAAGGVAKTQPVQVKAAKATIGQTLDVILAKASAEASPVAWYADKDLIVVTSQRQVLDHQLQSPPLMRGGDSGSPNSAKAPSPYVADRPVPSASEGLNFEDVPLKDVVEYLRQRSGVSFHVNWRALAVAGVDKETSITLKVSNISLRRVLDLLVDQLGATRDRETGIYWVIDKGVVTITTGASLNTDLSIRVVDVADLLTVVPNFRGPRIEMNNNQNNQSGTQSGTTSGNSGGLFSEADRGGTGTGGGRQTEEETMKESRERVRKDLVEIIKEAIGEDMWVPTGKGNVRLLGDKMIISQTKLGFLLLAKSGVLR